MIPPDQSSQFVAHMEHVLDVYKRPYNIARPVVCMDESPKQLIKETHVPLPGKPGQVAKYDYEYIRCGVCSIFLANEPLTGKRWVEVRNSRTRKDWAAFLEEIAKRYPEAERITLVMDNLNTHEPSSFYEVFPPDNAKALWDRFEFIYTPKHGSWLNMAEIELNVLERQCLSRRIADIETMQREVSAWQEHRNNQNARIDWQFTMDDARIKLKRLYPTLHD